MIREDFLRAYNRLSGSRWKRVWWCYRMPGLHAIAGYRFGHWLQGKPFAVRIFLKPLFLLHYRHIRTRWGIEISPETRIGPAFHIFHFGGIFIGANVVIGKDFSLSHDVTIGGTLGMRHGAPVIGDNVYVAPGAKISGGIKIGNNVRIGANAIVHHDVPDNALVQLSPVQVVTFPTQYSGGGAPFPDRINDNPDVP